MGTASLLGACQSLNSQNDNTANRAQEWQPQISMPSSVIVCREKECAPAKLSMSREYIYNSLTHLLEQNANEKALICMADPLTHTCVEDYVTLPITVGVTPAHLYINDVEITDVSPALNRRSLDLLLNYGISYNGQIPTCKPAKTLVYVKDAQNIVLEDAGYKCKMTAIGNTTIKTLFAIDYIDLDYGFVGGYYSIGLSGPAYGGGSRYMMFKFKNDAYPLSADLTLKGLELQKQAEQEERKAQEEARKAQELREKELKERVETLKKEIEALKKQQESSNVNDAGFNQEDEQLVILDENGNPVYAFEESTIFEGNECYSTVLEPMPCYQQWPCYEEPAVNKVVCPEPKVQEFTIITEEGEEIKRSKGVIEPKALKNVSDGKALNTKDIKPVKQQVTNMSVYNTPVSAGTKGMDYNGVQVFPIYKKKK